jgi:hypothetical protein
LITAYARGRDNDHFLVECLDHYIDDYADPDEFVGVFGSWVISVLEKIAPYVVAKEIRTFGRALRGHDSYVRLLIRLLDDPQAWDIYHEHLTRDLAQLSGDAVRRHLEEFEALATAARAQGRQMSGHFVELFTRAGAWEAASRLAHAEVAALPDDTWNRPRKLTADQIRVATELEVALAFGLTERVVELGAEWRTLEKAIEKDWTENVERRDPLWGLLGQNRRR